ncbi:hypothetical protein HG536_0B03250 [Torulaspora globosa]|uniref:GDP-Man:Man(3)GlcNAc(2)-PP-Dol alpha-1,2-mannosyltransferase n=1 Tax=Torulaspora globosa TaxID=48254 RepID=A0A7G3ZD76_9SACH|nr:uncharacterized protein HG536_0B03250 [Torulaspora globosa]QLL31462.1 hypothetical protein HG536_0B03250 [Torulaspora globosa]
MAAVMFSDWAIARLITIGICSFVFLKGLLRTAPYFTMKPPAKYRVRINNAIKKIEKDPGKNVKLDFGWKHGSVRRQMILASARPCEYSNGISSSNSISIGQSDKLHREEFVNKLVPELRRNKRVLYGFFHPYCNAGGGGEKVLWKAVESTLSKSSGNVALIYTGDIFATQEQILNSVSQRFDYELDRDRVVFIYLKNRRLVDSKTWPRFTLLGQAIGSIFLTLEALYKCPPDVWCDTMGYPFGYPFVHYFSHIPIVTYTHYPVISSDMLQKLQNMENARSLRITVKYWYWKAFMLWYKYVGSFVSIATTNSTWTDNHMKRIWNGLNSKILYPPCSTEKLVTKSAKSKRKNQAVVVAQFRPEKRHKLILKAFAHFLESLDDISLAPKLIMIGSTRSEADKDHVSYLRDWSRNSLQVPEILLEFRTDCPYEEIKSVLRESTYGINAMWNEHFGIAVVEYAASGLIPLVHASAGPLLDIVVPWDSSERKQAEENTTETRTGFFFKDKSDPDYNETQDRGKYPTLEELFITVVNLTDEEKHAISDRGRECVLVKFSDLKFHQGWDGVLDEVQRDFLSQINKREY